MTEGLKTIIYPVRDLARARDLYRTLLGTEPAVDAPYYVQFNHGSQEIGLDPNGHASGMTGPVGYWQVADIAAALDALLAAGAEAMQAMREVGGGRRIATVRDPDGNVIGLLQPA